MKVWIVTDESYDDRTIIGVFSTDEKAEAFVEANRAELVGLVSVESWGVDVKTPAPEKPLLGDGVPYDASAPIYWGPGTDFAGQELWPGQRDRVLREANGRWLLGRDGSIAFMALDFFVSKPTEPA